MAKGGGGGDDSSVEIYLIAFFIFLALLFFAHKYFYHELILIWKYIRVAESYAFIWLSYIIPGQWKPQFPDIIEFLMGTHHEDMSGDTVRMVDGHIRYYIGPIIGVFVFLLGSKMSKKSLNVSRRMDINSLLQDRANVFPHLEEYKEYDPNKELVEYEVGNEHAMVHAAPLTPSEYCLMNPPIGLEEKAKKRSDYRKSIWNKRDKFDIDLAKESLEAQLGPAFFSIDDIKNEYRMVFDYLNSKVKISRDEVYQMSISIINKHLSGNEMTWAEQQIYKSLTTNPKKKGKSIPFNYKMDKSSVRKIYNLQNKNKSLHKQFITMKSEGIMSRHAYQSTALVALMKEASSRNNFSLNAIRNKLKSKNRSLFYALNCAGRSGSFIESCGITAHFTFEMDTSEATTTPQVDLAVVGIQEELNLLESE